MFFSLFSLFPPVGAIYCNIQFLQNNVNLFLDGGKIGDAPAFLQNKPAKIISVIKGTL